MEIFKSDETPFSRGSPYNKTSRHNEEDDDDDMSSCEPGRGRGAKRSHSGSDRGLTPSTSRRKLRKNDREKQRRFELNNRFEVMSSILNLGQSTKTEKFTILSEAINMINALRAQNSNLREEKADLCAELQKLGQCITQSPFPGAGQQLTQSSNSREQPGLMSSYDIHGFTPVNLMATSNTAHHPGVRMQQFPMALNGMTTPTNNNGQNIEEDFDIFSS